MCGVALPVMSSSREFGLVAGELVWGDVLKLESQHVHTLDQNEVERDARDDARCVADGDEPAAAAQRPQRGLGQIAADRVDDGVRAVGQGVSQGGAQVARAVS